MIQKDFGMIYFPSPRAAAYMQVLFEVGRLPAHVVIMQSDRLKRAREVVADHPLSDQFFDLSFEITQFCITNNLSYTEIDTSDINSPQIASVLKGLPIIDWVFSGGGILRADLFALNKRFWHWHPGDLPDVKGSTCFYYSLLNNLQLVVSSFRMNDQIDAGEPTKRSSFRLNIHPNHLTTAFMDIVVDPWTRALALKACFSDEKIFYCEENSQKTSTVDISAEKDIKPPYSTIDLSTHDPFDRQEFSNKLSDRPCFIIHPLLRWLAIEKVAKTYNATKPETIELL